MNRNSLLALATLIALLWIESGNCKRKLQNDHEDRKTMQAAGKADEPKEAMREAARPVEKKMNKGTKQEAVRVEATGKTGGLVEKIMRDADEADEPDEESSEISRFQVSFEHGTAGATSIFEDAAKDPAKFRPALAFKSQIFKSPSEADRTYPWISVGQFPQTVYFRFPDPLTITKFSFRSRAEDSTKYPRYINLVEFSPTKFDFVGSDDCSEWETIMEARGVTWSTFDQEKLWIIPKEKQKSFACFGIRIVENGGNSFGTHGAIQGMKMWQSTGTTTSIDCYKGDRASYRGRKTSTNSGRICQNWASKSPHDPYRTALQKRALQDPNYDLTSNYCRNPDGEPEPWCYTTDKEKPWEHCGIPKCSVGGNGCGKRWFECASDEECCSGLTCYYSKCTKCRLIRHPVNSEFDYHFCAWPMDTDQL